MLCFIFQNEAQNAKDSLTCQSRGYGTQVTVKACGPLVFFYLNVLRFGEEFLSDPWGGSTH